MIDPILSWVETQRKSNNPFLLTVMTNVGHQNYTIPSSWNRQEFTSGDNEDYSNYLNCIAYIDDFLKQLFNEFQRCGIYKDTIFFVLGDHGDSFGEHGTKLRALSMYEEALHIPMNSFCAVPIQQWRINQRPPENRSTFSQRLQTCLDFP